MILQINQSASWRTALVFAEERESEVKVAAVCLLNAANKQGCKLRICEEEVNENGGVRVGKELQRWTAAGGWSA